MAQFRFHQEWYDDRLQFTHQSEFRKFEYINVARDQLLWIPDSFFQNERNGHYHMLDQVGVFFYFLYSFNSKIYSKINRRIGTSKFGRTERFSTIVG